MDGYRFNPDLLQVARFASGLSQKELAAQVNVGQNTLSRWESGLRDPSESEVFELAHALERPSDYFYRTERPAAIDAALMFHRKRARTKQSVLRQLHARINIARIGVTSLLKHIEGWDVRIPRLNIETHESSAEVARLVRASWQVRKGPIRNLVGLVEAAGAIVFRFDFKTDDIDAIGWWPLDSVPLIFLNENAPVDRVRFSLAHELAHLVLHELPSATMEKEADQFAGEFLVPEASVRTELAKIDTKSLWQMKRRWRVSGQCLVRRARDSGVIDANRFKSLMCYFSQKGWRKREPFPVEGETPTTLSRIMESFTNDLDYSRDELRALMGTTDEELETIFDVVREQPTLRVFDDDAPRKPR